MANVKPVIIQKNNLKSLNSLSNNIFQEDIIYRATPNDFLKGKYPNLVISNKLNKVNNSSQTRASFSSNNSSVVQLTSDAVTELIGQKNYDVVLSALCSVINQDLKIKALLSLLTTKKFAKNVTDTSSKLEKSNVATQTEQSCMVLLMKEKQRKKCRSRIAKPYVVTDQLTKVIIHPKEINSYVSIKKRQVKQENCEQDLPDLKLMDDELSNASWGSTGNLSILSDSVPNAVLYPHLILNNIDKHIEDIANHDTSTKSINEPDTVAAQESNMAHFINPKNEVNLHLTNNNSLIKMSAEEKHKLIIQQAVVDFKLCVQRDEDDNLPIHRAVLEDNASMLKRHCIMLNQRGESIDELSGNNFTALQMSIFHNSVKCMEVLLQFKADVFVTDDDGRTCFHLAAEKDTDHLKVLVEHCKRDVSIVLRQKEDLWNEFCDRRSNEGICEFLLRSISILCDSQGYTPLMLASKSGVAKNVKLLVEISPDTINMMMPNCGNTALYLAVAAACLDADALEDKSKVSQNYLETVETLIVNGGDPFLQNSSGTNVNDLLSDSNAGNPKAGYILTLSLLIANKLTSVKYFRGNNVKNFEKYMLIRNLQGDISIEDMHIKKLNSTSKTKKRVIDTKSVTSDENTSAVLPVNKDLYGVDSSIKSNVNTDKPKILQVTTVPSKICIHNKNRAAATRPLILRKNRNKSECEIKLKTDIANQQNINFVTILPNIEPGIKIISTAKKQNSEVKPTANQQNVKFVKILPKIGPGIKTISTTKRQNSEVKPTTSKKIKTINSVNT